MIQITPKALERALTAVKPAVNTRSAITALAGVRLHGTFRGPLRLSTTDMTVATSRMVTEAECLSDIDVLVSHAELTKVVKLFTKAPVITISGRDGARVTVANEDGKREITLPTLRMADFPPINFTDGMHVLTAVSARFADVILRASKFNCKDETRPVLTALALDLADERVPIIRATDSFRLTNMPVYGTVRQTKENPLLFPAALLKAVKTIVESDTVEVYADDHRNRRAYIRGAYQDWSFQLIDGQYPNFTQLIPDNSAFTTTIQLVRDELAHAAATGKALLTGKSPMRFEINGSVIASGSQPDGATFTETLNASVWTKEQDMTIGFNPDFLADIAAVSGGENVVMKLISPLRPGLFTSDGEEFLLMPIRLNV